MNEVRFDFSALSQVELGVFMSMFERIGRADFPKYRQVAEELSARAEGQYQDYLRGHALPTGKRVPSWLRGLGGGELAGKVNRTEAELLIWKIELDDRRAQQIEDGTPALDMKLGLPAYRKNRWSKKKGVYYLIVPFRHGVPGSKNMGRAMPKAIYAQAKQMRHSVQLGAPATRVSGSGFTVPKFAYRWRENLQLSLSEHDAATWKRYQGMYRMNKSRGKGVQTEYITFRTMSQNSAPGSWIRPAVEPMNALRTAIEVTWVNGRPALEAAMGQDLLQVLNPGKSL